MCGISLICNSNGNAVQAVTVQAMNSALRHRGPDTQNYQLLGQTALGHTRLSIVDIAAGHQPMTTEDKRYWITYNGEIYNFYELRKELEQTGCQFKTRSDTEVILQGYTKHGAAFLGRLRGMFAFCIYDQFTQQIFIARDRLGIKPLFYAHQGKQLLVASEIKAIFASEGVQAKLDQQSIRDHFKYQFSVNPYTSFENVYELPPGHFAYFDITTNKLQIKQYWQLEFPEDDHYESLDEKYWLDKLSSALDDATSSHTIGEVAIGAYLSGGLDSATTTYLLTQFYEQPLKTFSIHFTNEQSDESYAYKPVAKHLKVANEELTMEDQRSGGYLDLLRQCIYHLEQPQRMAVDIPHFLLSDFVQKQKYKVVYTGDGADEILAGYDCFRQDAMRIWGNEQENYAARKRLYLNQFTQHFAPDYMNLLLRLHKRKNQQAVQRQFGTYPAWFDFWHILDKPAEDIFSSQLIEETSSNSRLGQAARQWKPQLKNRHPLNQSLFIESKTRLPGWILHKSDRLSMAHGVEARVPFMDHPLVELCARMPPQFKLQGMEEKYSLKKIMQKHLPEIPGEYKKRGFYTPIREWFFSEPHKDQTLSLLNRESVEQAGMFDPTSVQRLFKDLLGRDTPKDMNSYYQTMQLEWALMLVLTSQLMHEIFVLKKLPAKHDISV